MGAAQVKTSDIHWCRLSDILHNFSLQFFPFHPHPTPTIVVCLAYVLAY